MRLVALVMGTVAAAAIGAAATSPAGAAVARPGAVLADSGFRPVTNGFSFANYGNSEGYENLAPSDVARLFGPSVCVRRVGTDCTLTPEAQLWMSQANREMAGGHCYGFSVLSLALFSHQLPALGSGTPFSLSIAGAGSLQHTIAYAFVQQELNSVVDRRVSGTPNHILRVLIKALSAGASQTYTLAIFRRDGTGGHAITPFAAVDDGGGRVSLLVYDNNHPGKTRVVSFNARRDSWSYNAATNPKAKTALYDGDARQPDLLLMPTRPGLGVQPCPFCRNPSRHAPGRSVIQLDGNRVDHGHLWINAARGGHIGISPAGRLVNTIRGARVMPLLASDVNDRLEPLYEIPDRPVTITLDGRTLARSDTESVSSIGPGHDVSVQGVRLSQGQRDVLRIGQSAEDLSYSAAPGQHGSPVIRVGFDGAQADFALNITLLNFRPGATLHVRLDKRRGAITLSQQGNSGTGRYVVRALRYAAKARVQELSVLRVGLHGRGPETTTL